MIKFRVWNEETNTMYYPGEDGTQLIFGVTHANGEEGYHTWQLWDEEGKIAREGNAEILRYTGLKDKNDEEIYEGDILNRKFEIGHTIYDPVTHGVVDYEITDSGHFIGVAHYRPSEGFVLAKVRKYNGENEFVEKKSAVKIYPRYAEIIGNRFENPELLEVAT